MRVRSLGREDSLEKGMAAHSSILAWRILWTEEGYSPWGCEESEAAEHSMPARSLQSCPILCDPFGF